MSKHDDFRDQQTSRLRTILAKREISEAEFRQVLAITGASPAVWPTKRRTRKRDRTYYLSRDVRDSLSQSIPTRSRPV